jgi:luciferase family oxidoreductase group 1
MALPLSVLDLVPVGSGTSSTQALANSVELATLAERLGYTRYWFAEHHGMPSIASSAPEILIAHIAAATRRIHVGSGGIMLQNHVPLKLAEVFHTLEALHPGRIDLGIGRAPGTDPATSRALHPFGPNEFTNQLAELRALSSGTIPDDHPFRSVRVIPTGVELPPIWMLGSSGGSAQLAGSLGLGYSFARHFSMEPAGPAIEAYRESFQPSPRFPVPHVILAVAVVCAPTMEEADYLAATGDLVWVRIRRGEFAPLPSPEEALAYPYTPQERAVADAYRARQFIGTPESVRARIEEEVRATRADEVMITSNIHSHAQRLRSFELMAEVFGIASYPTSSLNSSSSTFPGSSQIPS